MCMPMSQMNRVYNYTLDPCGPIYITVGDDNQSGVHLGRVVLDMEYLRYEFQMQYGSIGWVVGATLGYAQAA
ncbi:unnamed protein product [Camellia sinensis]